MTTFLGKIDPRKPANIDFGSDFNTQRWNEWCRAHIGEHIRIERPEPIRSLSQNALYWVWLAKVEHETGNESDDMHEYFKSKFLPKRLVKIKGKTGEHEVESIGSTTGLSKADFGQYLDRCAAHCGIPLPTREEIEAMGYISNH